MGWVGLGGFNVGLELHKCDIADGLGFIPEGDQETCHHNFDPPRRGWLPRFGTQLRYNLDGNLEDIAPSTDFTCIRCY